MSFLVLFESGKTMENGGGVFFAPQNIADVHRGWREEVECVEGNNFASMVDSKQKKRKVNLQPN